MTPGVYSRTAATAPTSRPVIDQGARSAGESHVRREERNGVLYVVAADGIAQPCASPRIADAVERSVRGITRA